MKIPVMKKTFTNELLKEIDVLGWGYCHIDKLTYQDGKIEFGLYKGEGVSCFKADTMEELEEKIAEVEAENKKSIEETKKLRDAFFAKKMVKE